MNRFLKFFWAGTAFLACLSSPFGAAIRLLAITPNAAPFQQALAGLESDLGDHYTIMRFDVACPNAADSLHGVIRTFAPQGLVLMDSKAIVLVKGMQGGGVEIASLPKFVLMTLKADGAVKGLENVAGIKFEVPAYTIFTHLRIISQQDFKKVGVFYRQNFSAFIEESKKLLAKEKMELVGECLDCGTQGRIPSGTITKKLKESMAEFVNQKAEVLWMLADNTLVNEATLKEFWLTVSKQYGVPVVVPLPNLASLEMNLGMFGVWPDYQQLGVQAAQQVIQVFESGESPSALGMEPLISVQTVVNLDMAQKVKWALNKEKLYRVSSVLRKN